MILGTVSCVYLCVFRVFFSYCIYVVLMSAQWDWSLVLRTSPPSVLWHCGWVFWPIKPIPDMTYNAFGGTLNLAQLNSTGYSLFWRMSSGWSWVSASLSLFSLETEMGDCKSNKHADHFFTARSRAMCEWSLSVCAAAVRAGREVLPRDCLVEEPTASADDWPVSYTHLTLPTILRV